MKLEIRAICGIERADIDIDGIALVVGQTGAGKTSIAEAARAALTNNWKVRGVTAKGHLGAVVHGGYDSGKVKISEGDAYSEMRFPLAEYTTAGLIDGKSVWSSDVAAGTANPLEMPIKDRTGFFIEMLKAAPKEQDTMLALQDVGLTLQQAGMVWKRIAEGDFDTTLRHYTERGQQLKGQWEEIAGDRWGSKKGETFIPGGWNEDLASQSTQALEAIVAKAKEALEGIIASAAISADRREQLQEKAAKLPDLRAQVFRESQEAEKIKARIKAAEDALAALPEPERKPLLLDCPHCGAASKLNVAGGDYSLTKDFEPVSDIENKRRQEKRDEAIEDLRSIRDESLAQSHQVKMAERLADDAEAAQAELEKPAGEGATEAQVNAQREAVALAEARLAMFNKKKDADARHRAIMLNAKVVDLLKPEGLRKRKLADAIADFNKGGLGLLNKALGTSRVMIDENLEGQMETAHGMRAYPRLSRGEKLMFHAALQIACANFDNSFLVVIDDADAVTGDLRSSLIKMAAAGGVPCLICMAVRAYNQVPDLAKLKMGRTYWVSGKTVVAVDEMENAA